MNEELDACEQECMGCNAIIPEYEFWCPECHARMEAEEKAQASHETNENLEQ